MDGWLAPGGAFYTCKPDGHEKTIRELINDGESGAYDIGWLKLEAGEWTTLYRERAVTFVQFGVLKDWHSANTKVMADWIRKTT
jgi:hypothetical protein